MSSQVIAYDSKQAISELQSPWTRLQWHPDSDFEYYLKVMEMEPELKPYILGLHENGEIKTLLIGSIKRMPIELRFGYKVFPSPNFNVFVLNYKGILGNTDKLECSVLFDALVKLLHQRKFDIVLFRNLSLYSPFHDLALSGVPFSSRDHFRIKQESWQATVPPSMNIYLSQHKNLKGYIKGYWANRLEKKYGTEIRIMRYSSLEQIDTILKDTEQIAELTWQRKLGADSFLTPNNRRRYEFYLSRNWLDAYILYIHGKPACFSHGIRYKSTYHIRHQGYDPAYREYRIGNYLTVHVIKDLCDSGDIRMFDYGEGNSEAKRVFCDVCLDVEDIHIFGPAIHLRTFNLMRASLTAIHLASKIALKKIGLYGSVRKYWRHTK